MEPVAVIETTIIQILSILEVWT